jgi:hypothetical protein
MSLNFRVKTLEKIQATHGQGFALVIRNAADKVVRLNIGETPEQALSRLNLQQDESVLFVERVIVEPQGVRL